jgi:hypothetical protein
MVEETAPEEPSSVPMEVDDRGSDSEAEYYGR